VEYRAACGRRSACVDIGQCRGHWRTCYYYYYYYYYYYWFKRDRECSTSTKGTRVVMEAAVVQWRPGRRPMVVTVSDVPGRRVFRHFRL